ncbi:MAG: sigma-70 family RNA polymerase sigma factor [Candidatus Saccharimonadales bacterium]|jgi:RNA polymerase sigma-70 factor (ECF subfamily)
MENFHDQTENSRVEPDEVTRVAWDVRGHLQHYHACDPQSAQANAALENAKATFSKLFSLTYNQLERSALQRTGGDFDAVSDILQETYILAWENLPKLRGDSKFTTWLYHIMFNQLSDFYRKQSKYVLGQEEDFGWQLGAMPSQDNITDNPEIHLENTELQETLFMHIADQLTPKERETLIGRYFHEIKYKKLAQQLGDKSVSAAKVRVHRAIIKLRNVYQSHLQ